MFGTSPGRITFESHLEKLKEPVRPIMVDLRKFVISLYDTISLQTIAFLASFYMVLRDLDYMQKALEQAQIAGDQGEVPIGAVVVSGDGTVLGCGANLVETRNDPLAHAEIVAIQDAARARGDWRLSDCTIYITLEPCAMCMQAIIRSRIATIVFGARSPVCGFSLDRCTVFRLYKIPVTVREGVGAHEASELLKKFKPIVYTLRGTYIRCAFLSHRIYVQNAYIRLMHF